MKNKERYYTEENEQQETMAENENEYLENLTIDEQLFKELSTPSNKRCGSRGKTKQAWRTTDGIKYPVTTYKASELKEGLKDE